jgi:hypothetical protein
MVLRWLKEHAVARTDDLDRTAVGLVLNPATGAPLATTSDLRPADQEIFHDPAYPSTLTLPTTSAYTAHGIVARAACFMSGTACGRRRSLTSRFGPP